jgi:hypothetical protein
MKFLLTFLLGIVALMITHADQKHDELKDEIEAVAIESKHLANELAEMLLAMEVEELKEEVVDSTLIRDDHLIENALQATEARIKKLENDLAERAEKDNEEKKNGDGEEIIEITFSKKERLRKPLKKLEKIVEEIKTIALAGDSEEKVKKILKDMDARITQLEKESNKRNYEHEVEVDERIPTKENEDLTLAEEFSNKEERLRGALHKFKNISKELKSLNLSSKSKDDTASVSQLAKIVEAMTAKLSLDEMQISVNLAFGKGKKISIVKNDIETMIDSLVDVVEQLSEDGLDEY